MGLVLKRCTRGKAFRELWRHKWSIHCLFFTVWSTSTHSCPFIILWTRALHSQPARVATKGVFTVVCRQPDVNVCAFHLHRHNFPYSALYWVKGARGSGSYNKSYPFVKSALYIYESLQALLISSTSPRYTYKIVLLHPLLRSVPKRMHGGEQVTCTTNIFRSHKSGQQLVHPPLPMCPAPLFHRSAQ